MATKISITTFVEFQKHYDSSEFDLRFGQAFLNKFFPTMQDYELFYEPCRWACIGMIWAKYIDIDEVEE